MNIRSIFSGFALSLATVLIMLLALEAGLRIADTTREQLVFDPVLGYVPKPNSEVTTATPEYTTVKHVNSEGFWGHEYPREKPAGIKRVIVVGDSFTEARQVETPLSYPALIEKDLNASDAVKWQVVNLGRGGYGTTRENYILEHFGLSYDPDIIVLGFFVGNDIMNNLSERDLGKSQLNAAVMFKARTKTFLINHFALVRSYLDLKARNKVFAYFRGDIGTSTGHIIPPDFHVFFKELPDDANDGYSLTKEQLTRMQRTADKHGAELLVILIPDRMQVYPDFRLPEYADFDIDRPNRELASFLNAAGIRFVDLLPPFRRYAAEHPDAPLYGAIDSHFNDHGHAEMAKEVARYVRNELQ